MRFHLTHEDPIVREVFRQLDCIEQNQKSAQALYEEILAMKSDLQAAFDKANSKMTELTSVIDAAVVYIQSVPNLIRQAVADAVAAGGDDTDAVNAALALADQMDADAPKTAAAIAANTKVPVPVLPPTPVPVVVSAPGTVADHAQPPVLTQLSSRTAGVASSATGPAGTVVQIAGSGFSSLAGLQPVMFTGKPGHVGIPAEYTVGSDTSIMATVPEGADAGPGSFVITTMNGVFTSAGFTVTA